MTNLRSHRQALAYGLGAALLAGCGGQSATPQATTARAVPQNAAAQSRLHQASGESWMLPEAKSEDLLYIASYEGAVYVYSYPAGILVGTLNERGQPWAPCSDASGNVWIPVSENDGRSNLAEYAHGGTKRLTVLRGFGPIPRGCAVDGVTGDVAVTNYCSDYVSQYCYNDGSVAIFKRGQGRPHVVKDAEMGYYWSCAYDSNGNLFVDATNKQHRAVVIGELARGHGRFVNLSLSAPPAEVGSILWDGTYLAVEDPSASSIARLSINGKRGRVVGTTPINGGQYITGFSINGQIVIVPDYKGNNVGFYDYPDGGSAQTTITVTLPTGVTVSVPPSAHR